ncbi:hypothetical protein [Amycolatopsis sp. lyj-84]|uniref:hypothetical protein n=1 Tax=Amycolatopsis sp. lyj-84 TaxID=2789284 RepID=UPI003978854D
MLGTLEEGGLAAFDLRARRLQQLAVPAGGRFNNVDVVGDLAVASRPRSARTCCGTSRILPPHRSSPPRSPKWTNSGRRTGSPPDAIRAPARAGSR